MNIDMNIEKQSPLQFIILVMKIVVITMFWMLYGWETGLAGIALTITYTDE